MALGGERNVDGFVSLGNWANLRMMPIVRLASRLRTFRDGNAGFDAALGGMEETIIESEVDGPSEDPSDDNDDAGLISCRSGTLCKEEQRLQRLWCAYRAQRKCASIGVLVNGAIAASRQTLANDGV